MTTATKALAKKPAKSAELFGSAKPFSYAELEKTIEQMYFQGKDVSPEKKIIFKHAVEKTGLDPIMGQIRPVLRQNYKTKEWDMAIQTSIDGYRLMADRTAVYAGSDEPLYQDHPTEKWHPAKATVTVHKLVGGQRCAFTASARWEEYYPELERQQFMWKKMPFLMLAKCTEALALRKAFPADLSGIYTDDEMQQAAPAEVVTADNAEKQVKEVFAESKPAEVKDKVFLASTFELDEIKRLCGELQRPVKEDKLLKLNNAQAQKLIAELKREIQDKQELLDASIQADVETDVSPSPSDDGETL